MKNLKGFTIVELMVSVAILGLLTLLAIPSMSDWLVRMRIDNEISQLHRLINTARNTAVTLQQPVTVCPLNNGECSNDWTKKLTLFIDLNNNGKRETSVAIDIDNDGTNDGPFEERIIRVKNAIADSDNLVFGRSRVVYTPLGQAVGSNATFAYCVTGHSDKNRGLVISPRGRVYQTKDYDGDGKEDQRDGTDISCP